MADHTQATKMTAECRKARNDRWMDRPQLVYASGLTSESEDSDQDSIKARHQRAAKLSRRRHFPKVVPQQKRFPSFYEFIESVIEQPVQDEDASLEFENPFGDATEQQWHMCVGFCLLWVMFRVPQLLCGEA